MCYFACERERNVLVLQNSSNTAASKEFCERTLNPKSSKYVISDQNFAQFSSEVNYCGVLTSMQKQINQRTHIDRVYVHK